jgi:hypothetical protein
VFRWKFRSFAVIDQKNIGVVSTETEIWFFEKGVKNSNSKLKKKLKIEIENWKKYNWKKSQISNFKHTTATKLEKKIKFFSVKNMKTVTVYLYIIYLWEHVHAHFVLNKRPKNWIIGSVVVANCIVIFTNNNHFFY